MNTFIDTIRAILLTFPAALFSFWFGGFVERKNTARRLFAHFYFPMFKLLKPYIDDAKACSKEIYYAIYAEIEDVFASSGGVFPWDMYDRYVTLTYESFPEFCRFFKLNFWKCVKHLDYKLSYKVPFSKEKRTIWLFVLAFCLAVASYVAIFKSDSFVSMMIFLLLFIIGSSLSIYHSSIIDYLIDVWKEKIKENS